MNSTDPSKEIRMKPLLTVAALAAFLSLAGSAHATWTVIILSPAGSTGSFAFGVGDGQQVGSASVGGIQRASLWDGTAASWVDLSPAGATSSEAGGVSGGKQAGAVHLAGVERASLWSGTAASRVDLHPAGSTYSYAFAISGGQEVGYAKFGGIAHAGLWNGTAASWVDLSPANAFGSVAEATSVAQQAGLAIIDNEQHASLWSGTAASWVDLNPAGATWSVASAVGGGQQAGVADVGGVQRASLWSGTAASWVDLNPAGSTRSDVRALSGGQQVGEAAVGGVVRASLWNGTAASWVDLSASLPPEFSSSIATGLWNDGTNTYITGFGNDTVTGQDEAMLWTDLAFSEFGFGLAGVNGIPHLSGSGTLAAGTPGSLSLTLAAPSSPALLFVSLGSVPVPFKGGTLIAFAGPATLEVVLGTDGSGALLLPFAWPSGVPQGTSLYFQYAVEDAAAIHGVALSNALKGVTP